MVATTQTTPAVVFSFDVEEHHRIEAAFGITCSPERKSEYADRMEAATRRLLDLLDETGVKATFFVVGEIAVSHRLLVRDMADAGHEVGSHGWDHKSVKRQTPESFAEDLRISKDALEQAAGQSVAGYRAPTFSVVRATGWAADVLAASGLRYDSSVFPVRHDRYGVPDAPRGPFVLEGVGGRILELPPVTYRVAGRNVPVAGGGYFRLFPLRFMRAGLRQSWAADPAVGMLYFHPWEFDPDQPRLSLGRLSAWRTYVGTKTSTARLRSLLTEYRPLARRAVDVVDQLEPRVGELPRFRLTPA
jgi:polysaccharide deacetylase family protein (PEP-CTERM system associated)